MKQFEFENKQVIALDSDRKKCLQLITNNAQAFKPKIFIRMRAVGYQEHPTRKENVDILFSKKTWLKINSMRKQIVKSLKKPLKKQTRSVSNINQKEEIFQNLEVKVFVQDNKEIRIMINTFNNMINKLFTVKQHFNQLAKKIRMKAKILHKITLNTPVPNNKEERLQEIAEKLQKLISYSNW